MGWQFESLQVTEIGEIGDLGFARCKAFIVLAGGPNGSFMDLEVDVPLTYEVGWTIERVQEAVRVAVIDGLRATLAGVG